MRKLHDLVRGSEVKLRRDHQLSDLVLEIELVGLDDRLCVKDVDNEDYHIINKRDVVQIIPRVN